MPNTNGVFSREIPISRKLLLMSEDHAHGFKGEKVSKKWEVCMQRWLTTTKERATNFNLLPSWNYVMSENEKGGRIRAYVSVQLPRVRRRSVNSTVSPLASFHVPAHRRRHHLLHRRRCRRQPSCQTRPKSSRHSRRPSLASTRSSRRSRRARSGK